MDEAREAGWLEAVGLATLHVSLLVGALVLALHRAGTLGQLLQGIGTLPGVALFLVLWGLTLGATRQALVQMREKPLREAMGVGGVWGGAVGASFVWIALTASFISGRAPPIAYLFSLEAAAFGFVGGCLVGAVAALLDTALLAAARRLAR